MSARRVRIDVRSARDGRLLDQFEVTDRAEFFVARGESLATATEESFFDLARKIVMGLEKEFPRSKRQGGTSKQEAPDG